MIEALNVTHGQDWTMYHGDCVEVVSQLPEGSVDFSVYSPPFASLYTYSDSVRDMGNTASDAQFMGQYQHMIGHLCRAMRPGRCVAVHVKDMPSFKFRDGQIALRDFSGEIIRAHLAAGFSYHTRITVWKDPVTEMQRTKALGLLHKQIKKDSTWSRVGMPDYVLVFRRYPKDGDQVVPVTHTNSTFPVDQWQKWASPVWMDIDQGNTLNARLAREADDERHMCPLQLDLIDRAIRLWSNPGDVVLSPFGGIGSEGVGAIEADRKYVGVELKESYYRRACINLRETEGAEQVQMFGAK